MQVHAEETFSVAHRPAFIPAWSCILLVNHTVMTEFLTSVTQCGLTLPVVLSDGNFVSSRFQVVRFDHAHFLLEHLRHRKSRPSQDDALPE